MACISALTPRLSWALCPQGAGIYYTQPTFMWNSNIALLMRFPITEAIPKGQRVTRAEFTLWPQYIGGTAEAHIHMRRILAEWGNGVCHQYRMVHPRKLEWASPGGRGASTDRANKSSAVFKVVKLVEQSVDITEDVELWYTGAVPNRGWILTIEGDNHHLYLPSPYPSGANAKYWKLQITYEPR